MQADKRTNDESNAGTSSENSVSSAAGMNKERLRQDTNVNVFNEETETDRNDRLNEGTEPTENSSSDTSQAVETMGDNGIDDQEDLGIVMGTDADVTSEDLALLGDKDQDMDGGDDEMYAKPGLDDTDLDGEPLNEAATDMSSTGDDLDLPDEEQNDPRKDAMGQGDEENDYYSLGSDRNDEVTEGTP
jgi:hypothetical protein